MNHYKIAGVYVSYEPKFDLLRQRSKPYLCTGSGKTEFTINVDEEKPREQLPKYPLLNLQSLEYMAVGADFYSALIERGGLLLHASAVVVNGVAYAFSAPSGTGKSTHTSLWLDYFKKQGKNTYIINDDKPALKLVDGKFYAYGTPFSGKNDLNVNTGVPLKAIGFIERSQKNYIEKIKPITAVTKILDQTIRPSDNTKMTKLLDLIEKLVTQIDVYVLHCNISEEAVITAYSAMSGDTIE